ncbi:MAG: heme exporter protein CcmB [Aestuariivirgaceae bacterium]
MTALAAIVARDLRLALRQGGGAGIALGFFLTVLVLIPLGIGPDVALLARIAPGTLWIALLLSVLLSADRIFEPDHDDGSLEIMTLGPVPLELIVLAKAAAHWLATALPMAVAAPFFGLLLNLDPALFLPLGLAMLLASLALSLLASLVAAVTVGLKRGGLLLSILTLPLYVPALIFGVAASAGDETLSGSRPAALLILLALVLLALAIAPFAGAAALRAHLR